MRKILFLIPIIIFYLFGCEMTSQMPCEHKYVVNEVVNPTCIKEGKKIEICIKCKHTVETVIETIDHDYELKEQEATCEKEGKVYEVCKNCNEEKLINTVAKLQHTLEETSKEATCEEEGYTLFKCSKCSFEEKKNIKEALKHDLSAWEVIKNPTDTQDGLQKRKCSRCEYVEEEIILSSSYIDLSIIREVFDETLIYSVDSYEKLLVLFQCAIFNHVDTFKCKLNFSFNSLQELIDALIEDETLIIHFSSEVEYLDDLLTFNFSYHCEPFLSTSNICYTQYDSFNYMPIEKERIDTFDNFGINNSIYSYNVETSEQLFYVLERGTKPICKEGSTAEVIYEELKKILINIINDDMTDLEKIKAIHDYLVINVVYDDDLLQEVIKGNTVLEDYKGFYLEGVVLDKKAVCEGISKTFTALCNIEGIPCVTVDGYQTNNPNGVGHAWNKVYLNDSWYIVDATSDGTIINDTFEILTYKYFLIDEATYQTKYTGTNFTNIQCNKNIDIYQNMFFTYNEDTYDFNIESLDELDKIIAYFESTNNKCSTIEFKLDFDYGEDCHDEINNAYLNNHLAASYSYIENGNIFMIIKGE